MTTTPPTALEPVVQAAGGLLFQSETDAPLTPVFWPNVTAEELTPARLVELVGAPENAVVECVSVSQFFRNATTSEEWHNEEETAQVERFKALVKTLKKVLAGEKVFRVGERKLDCYIVGSVEGGCGGLKTQVVET